MATISPDLFFATIPELNALLVKREVSAEELAKAFTARLEPLGPRINSLAQPMPQEASRKAKLEDGDLKRPRQRLAVWYDLAEQTGQRRGGDHRQTFDGGAGGRRRIPVSLGVADRAWAEPVGPDAVVRGIVERTGGGGGGGADTVRDRVGDVGVDCHAGRFLWGHGAAPDLRPGQPLWRDGAFLDAR